MAIYPCDSGLLCMYTHIPGVPLPLNRQNPHQLAIFLNSFFAWAHGMVFTYTWGQAGGSLTLPRQHEIHCQVAARPAVASLPILTWAATDRGAGPRQFESREGVRSASVEDHALGNCDPACSEFQRLERADRQPPFGGKHGSIRILASSTGRQTGSLRGHTAQVQSIAYNRNGSRLVSAGLDGAVRVWEPLSRRELLVMPPQGGMGLAAIFSPDGTQLARACEDGTVHIADGRPRDGGILGR